MLSEKNIVVTIGNYGAVIALHSGSKIDEKVFLSDFDDNARTEMARICLANKSVPIYVLLDTIDQSYKKKIYPLVRRSDLTRIVKRDLATDGDSTSLRGYMVMNSAKKPNPKQGKQVGGNRWECLFISSSDSELINKWVDYLVELPNHLVGIYMSPVETFSLFQALQQNIKAQSKTKNKRNELYCMVLHSQVGGSRQVVFSGQGIVFTRVVTYDFNQTDFLEKYEHDLYSTFEYLKRIYPSLAMAELDIVNIFPNKILAILEKTNNPELSLVNYTPNDAANKAGIGSALDPDTEFCDLLVSKIFSKKKKLLKFTTPKITVLEKFFLAIKASYYLNLVLIVLIIATALITLLSQDKIAQSIEAAEADKYSVNEELAKLKKLAFEGAKITDEDQVVTAERVIDFGKIDEVLNTKDRGMFDYYTKLNFLKKMDVKVKLFSYAVSDFKEKSPSPRRTCQVNFSGTLYNSNGDIDNLFSEFDSLTGEMKKQFGSTKVKYDELPRTLDFSSKYYEYPVSFMVNDGGDIPTPDSSTSNPF